MHACMQVWTGGHDTKVCALDARGSVQYQVGTLKENGDIVQPGGTKAIVRSGWNAWVFGAKTISVYAPSCLADEAEQARLSAEHDKARMARNLKSSEEALKRSQQDLSDLTALLSKERDQWEGLGAEQQKALEGLKADRDAAVESKRQLDTEVSTRLLLHHSNLASSKRTMS